MTYAKVSTRQRRERALQALEWVGLGDSGEALLERALWAVKRQRVAIARALVNNPSLLLADEPTGNLDSATSDEIMTLIDDLHDKGNTVLLVTHEPEIAEHADRQIVLRDGKILSDTLTQKVGG